MSLLTVENLEVNFGVGAAAARAVRGVSLSVAPREIVGLVGESGSGKSVSGLAIMGLLETPPAQISADKLQLRDVDLTKCNSRIRRSLCGKEMAMIFQEPMTSLNPVFTIGEQIGEALASHFPEVDTLDEKIIAALDEVHIADSRRMTSCYPHELSGGMKQRVMIAMALICRPALLIADEPTTALDVTVQAQILSLLKEIQIGHEMGMLFITHDLGVVAELTDRVCVMYAGKIVESAPTADFFAAPKHPYALALLQSVPQLRGERKKLRAIPGIVPSPRALPDGCKFAPRCERASEKCRESEPNLRPISDNHFVACPFA